MITMHTAEFAYLGVASRPNSYISTGIKCRIRAAWIRPQRSNSQLYVRPKARLCLKILLIAELVEAMLYGWATRVLRPERFGGLRNTHHKLTGPAVGFRKKDRSGHQTLSYRAALEMA